MDQAELLTRVVRAFESAGVPYAITGSQASIAYGEIRFTNDIDVLVELSQAALPSLLSHFPPDEFYVSADAARIAISTGGQFNIIHPTSGQKIDVIIAASEFDRRALARVRSLPVMPDRNDTAQYISREDLILKKMEFYREGGSDKHLRDIVGMLSVTGEPIDRVELHRAAAAMGLADVWAAILQRTGERGR